MHCSILDSISCSCSDSLLFALCLPAACWCCRRYHWFFLINLCFTFLNSEPTPFCYFIFRKHQSEQSQHFFPPHFFLKTCIMSEAFCTFREFPRIQWNSLVYEKRSQQSLKVMTYRWLISLFGPSIDSKVKIDTLTLHVISWDQILCWSRQLSVFQTTDGFNEDLESTKAPRYEAKEYIPHIHRCSKTNK